MIDDDTRGQVRKRLNRIAGQVAGLQRMLDESAPCVELLLQISAVQGALGSAGRVLLTHHVQRCVREALERGDEAEKQHRVDELIDVLARYSKLGGGR